VSACPVHSGPETLLTAESLASRLQSLAAKESTVRQQASGLRDRVEDAKASLAAGKGDDAMLSGLKKLQEMGRLDGFYVRT
jgi:structural maintenance of chromosome 4